MRKLILASASPRRRELLAGYGRDFSIEISQTQELPEHALPPSQLALANAELKAADVSSRHPEAIVIGADTTIDFESEAIGKPADLKEAFAVLRRLSGKPHIVSTGVCILSPGDDANIHFIEHSRVFFKKLDDAVIARYLELVHVLDKAGSYAVQKHGDMLIDRIEGSVNNVIGFPTEKIFAFLRSLDESSSIN